MKYFTKTPATEAELKEQYRQLVQIHHPDKPTGSTETFQEMQQEYIAVKLKLKEPGIDYEKIKTIMQAARAGIDAYLQFTGHKPTAEMLPEQAVKIIDNLKLPAFLEKQRVMLKMIIAPNADPDIIIDFIISAYKSLNNKKTS